MYKDILLFELHTNLRYAYNQEQNVPLRWFLNGSLEHTRNLGRHLEEKKMKTYMDTPREIHKGPLKSRAEIIHLLLEHLKQKLQSACCTSTKYESLHFL